MLAPEIPARHDIAWVSDDWPSVAEDHELPEEPWLPARDVSLMTLAAFALIALLQLFH